MQTTYSATPKSRLLSAIDVFILLLAVTLRLWMLDIKPAHFDEGVNGWFADQMAQTGYYKYDPTNYHGPLHFYILFISQSLLGRNLWALRLPTVAISIASVWLMFRFSRFFGFAAARWAALAIAVSPAFIFYSRYAIHESWLVFFSMLTLYGALLIRNSSSDLSSEALAKEEALAKKASKATNKNLLYPYASLRRAIVFIATGITGMILTKETYIIHLTCFLLAIPTLHIWNQLFIQPTSTSKRKNRASVVSSFRSQWSNMKSFITTNTSTILLAVTLSIGTILFFYSGTFMDWSALPGIWQTYTAWFATGAESAGHEKAAYQLGFVNYYWLALMARYEWPALLGLVISIITLLPFKKAIWPSLKFPHLLKRWQTSPRSILAKASSFAKASEDKSEDESGIKDLEFTTRNQIRFIAIFGCGVLATYSIIPYKTPWCIISILWPFLMVFGATIATKFNSIAQHSSSSAELTSPASSTTGFRGYGHNQSFVGYFAIFIAIVSVSVSLFLTIRLNLFHYTDETEPYVYVQTYTDINKLITPLQQYARQNPSNYGLRGDILLESYFPIPWLLGDFYNIAYYKKDNWPAELTGDFIVMEKSQEPIAQKLIKGDYTRQEFRLRSAQDTCIVYWKNDMLNSTLFPSVIE